MSKTTDDLVRSDNVRVTEEVARLIITLKEGIFDRLLIILGENTGVDRCFILRFDDGRLNKVHEWAAPGIDYAFKRLMKEMK